MTRGLPTPRYIKPETACIGDLLKVEYPEQNGLTRSHVGRVGSRQYDGQRRMLVTAEDAVLVTWEPSVHDGSKITLLERRTVVDPSDAAAAGVLF